WITRASPLSPPRGTPSMREFDADRVRAGYDAVARAYDEKFSGELDHKPLDRALLNALCEMTIGGTLADVGCGPGHVSRFLAGRHPDVVGIDLSPAMI